MSTTAATIETIKSLLGEKIEAWADEQFFNVGEGNISTDALELLDIDEDEAIERFGEEITDLLCKVEVSLELESFEVERATRWDPGFSVSEGWLSVIFTGPEVNPKDFGGWTTTFGNGSVQIAEGKLDPEDGLHAGLTWQKVKVAA